MTDRDPLLGCTSFEWDDGNATKNWERHKVAQAECEEVFFLEPLLVSEDSAHSRKEARFYALGQTSTSRKLFVVFTIRGERIRVTSARNMSRRERRIYERAQARPED
ncbi:BrnT family toxin [bacterium]|nr:BrnT family toxin [bacterium]